MKPNVLFKGNRKAKSSGNHVSQEDLLQFSKLIKKADPFAIEANESYQLNQDLEKFHSDILDALERERNFGNGNETDEIISKEGYNYRPKSSTNAKSYKRECINFLKGNCSRGNSCWFAHTSNDISNETTSTKSVITQLEAEILQLEEEIKKHNLSSSTFSGSLAPTDGKSSADRIGEFKLDQISTQSESKVSPTKKTCFEFSKRGSCRHGSRCYFEHVSSVPVGGVAKVVGQEIAEDDSRATAARLAPGKKEHNNEKVISSESVLKTGLSTTIPVSAASQPTASSAPLKTNLTTAVNALKTLLAVPNVSVSSPQIAAKNEDFKLNSARDLHILVVPPISVPEDDESGRGKQTKKRPAVKKQRENNGPSAEPAVVSHASKQTDGVTVALLQTEAGRAISSTNVTFEPSSDKTKPSKKNPSSSNRKGKVDELDTLAADQVPAETSRTTCASEQEGKTDAVVKDVVKHDTTDASREGPHATVSQLKQQPQQGPVAPESASLSTSASATLQASQYASISEASGPPHESSDRKKTVPSTSPVIAPLGLIRDAIDGSSGDGDASRSNDTSEHAVMRLRGLLGGMGVGVGVGLGFGSTTWPADILAITTGSSEKSLQAGQHQTPQETDKQQAFSAPTLENQSRNQFLQSYRNDFSATSLLLNSGSLMSTSATSDSARVETTDHGQALPSALPMRWNDTPVGDNTWMTPAASAPSNSNSIASSQMETGLDSGPGSGLLRLGPPGYGPWSSNNGPPDRVAQRHGASRESDGGDRQSALGAPSSGSGFSYSQNQSHLGGGGSNSLATSDTIGRSQSQAQESLGGNSMPSSFAASNQQLVGVRQQSLSQQSLYQQQQQHQQRQLEHFQNSFQQQQFQQQQFQQQPPLPNLNPYFMMPPGAYPGMPMMSMPPPGPMGMMMPPPMYHHPMMGPPIYPPYPGYLPPPPYFPNMGPPGLSADVPDIRQPPTQLSFETPTSTVDTPAAEAQIVRPPAEKEPGPGTEGSAKAGSEVQGSVPQPVSGAAASASPLPIDNSPSEPAADVPSVLAEEPESQRHTKALLSMLGVGKASPAVPQAKDDVTGTAKDINLAQDSVAADAAVVGVAVTRKLPHRTICPPNMRGAITVFNRRTKQPVLSVQPQQDITVKWRLTPEYWKHKSPTTQQALMLGLFRYGIKSNQNSVFVKKLIVRKGPMAHLQGEADCFAPKEAGKFVFRIFDNRTDNVAETVATSDCLSVELWGVAVTHSLKRLSESFSGVESAASSARTLMQLQTTISGIRDRGAPDGRDDPSVLMQSCFRSVLALVQEAIKEWNELEKKEKQMSKAALEEVKSNGNTEADNGDKEDAKGNEAYWNAKHQCVRTHADAMRVLSHLKSNPTAWQLLLREQQDVIATITTFFCPLQGRFFDSVSDMDRARMKQFGYLPSPPPPIVFDKHGQPTSVTSSWLSSPLLLSLNKAIQMILPSILPSEGHATKRESVRVRLRDALLGNSVVPPGTDIGVFGSSTNTFGSDDADLDMCLILPLQVSALTGAGAFSGDSTDSRSLLIETVGKFLTEAAGGMSEVSIRSTARIPIVLFKDPISGLDCDISFNNPLAMRNTRLLAAYSSIDERLRQLAFLIKKWAKVRGINDPQQGTLSSYGYLLCLIHFLQTRSPPILPSLQQLPPQWPDKTVPLPGQLERWDAHPVDGRPCNTYFLDPTAAGAEKASAALKAEAIKNTQTVGELFAEFFLYFGWLFDAHNNVVSVRMGRAVDKTLKAEESCWSVNDKLCIEDPFEHWYDVAHVLRGPKMDHFLKAEFLRAYTLIARAEAIGNASDRDLAGLDSPADNLPARPTETSLLSLILEPTSTRVLEGDRSKDASGMDDARDRSLSDIFE